MACNMCSRKETSLYFAPCSTTRLLLSCENSFPPPPSSSRVGPEILSILHWNDWWVCRPGLSQKIPQDFPKGRGHPDLSLPPRA